MINKIKTLFLCTTLLVTLFGCKESISQNQINEKGKMNQTDQSKLQLATFGSGCFWCSEAIFERVKGVTSVISGYSGGKVDNPTYEDVCSGKTGHAEGVQIKCDSELGSY